MEAVPTTHAGGEAKPLAHLGGHLERAISHHEDHTLAVTEGQGVTQHCTDRVVVGTLRQDKQRRGARRKGYGPRGPSKYRAW